MASSGQTWRSGTPMPFGTDSEGGTHTTTSSSGGCVSSESKAHARPAHCGPLSSRFLSPRSRSRRLTCPVDPRLNVNSRCMFFVFSFARWAWSEVFTPLHSSWKRPTIWTEQGSGKKREVPMRE